MVVLFLAKFVVIILAIGALIVHIIYRKKYSHDKSNAEFRKKKNLAYILVWVFILLYLLIRYLWSLGIYGFWIPVGV